MIKAIGQKLAAAGVQDANFYPEGMHGQEVQNWREYLARERQNLSDGLVIELPVSVLAFGRQADALAKHHKGELVSVAGNMQVSQWTGQNGETRRGWQVIADSVISARTARPGGKKGQQGQATDALNRAKQQSGNDDPYGDNIPF